MAVLGSDDVEGLGLEDAAVKGEKSQVNLCPVNTSCLGLGGRVLHVFRLFWPPWGTRR